jgi:hypothetical protein
VSTPQNILLVVQTPDHEGTGHEFLVGRMDFAKFDRNVWEKGKSDELILALALMKQQGVGHCRAEIDVGTFVQSMQERNDDVERVKLDFALPTPDEVANAALRRDRAIIAKQITNFEMRIDGCNKFIASTEAKLEAYRTHLKQPNLLVGIRLHYEHVLIADKITDLHVVRNEQKQTYQNLKRALALQKRLNDKKET